MKQVIILAFLASHLMTTIPATPQAKPDFRPPGTVEIVDNFFMDSGEIRNADWKEYLAQLKTKEGENSKRYINALPDPEVWVAEGKHNQPLVDSYLYNPSYDNYPVVGISYSQALDYCKWRTEAVIKMLDENGFDRPKNFKYRLPTKTEWELIASAGYSKKQRKILRKQHNEDLRFTCNMRFSESNKDTQVPYTSPTRTYLPNKYGIFNLYGNVAEMTQEAGIAMGGSFTHNYYDIVPTNKPITYDGPQNWLGFRCVCEIIEV